jgi:acetoin utilization protein AcuB
MLVGERMSHPVIYIAPNLPINEALNLMRKENIRRLPVTDKGKLVGIVSIQDLLNASPSPATSLSIWEINYLLSKVTVKDVMTKKVITVTEDTPIEEAARLMADNKIGGVPVVRGDKVIGIITETDLFKVFLELLGARERGVRVTMLVHNRPGELAKISLAICKEDGNIIASGTFAGDDPSTSTITMKVSGVEEKRLKEIVQPLVINVKDIRTC